MQMMTRDVLLEMELEEDDDDDGDIGEPRVPGVGRRGAPRPLPKARAKAGEVGDCAWAPHPREWKLAGTLGRSEELGCGGPWWWWWWWWWGGWKPAPPAPGRSAAASRRGPAGERAAPVKAGEARGKRWSLGQFPDGRGTRPLNSHGSYGDAPERGSLDSEQQLLGHFLRLEPARAASPWAGFGERARVGRAGV